MNGAASDQRRPWSWWLSASIVAIVVARVSGIVWSALHNTRGDYYASMPGAYVRTANPVLWDSPDLQGAWGYHLDTYFHGPVQYLTLYGMAWLDSYRQIALWLLPIYAVVLAFAFWCLRQTARRLAPDHDLTVPLLASTFLFFPLLQAYLQREFEVVITLALAWALLQLVRGRQGAAAAVFAYAAWYKYIPLLFLGYFGLRRWFTAIGVFALVSAAILGLAHAVFGLPLFFNNNVPSHAAQVLALWEFGFRTDAAGHLIGTGFCTGWFDNETTLANVRHGLCTVGAAARWLPVTGIYLAICAAVAAIYLHTHWRLEQRAPGADIERWRRALEVSIVITVCACFFFSHYYYLIALVIPFNMLLIRYLSQGRHLMLGGWALSYFLVSAFVIPIGVLSRLAGADVWEPYIWGAWFLPGELLLMGLLVFEYRSLAR